MILSLLKTILILILLYKMSCIFPPLRILFASKMIVITIFQYLYIGIINERINVNKLPYVGNLFIIVDSIFLYLLNLVTKN